MNKHLLMSTFLMMTILGCSNLSKNMVEDGTLPIRNGVSSDKSWNENLIFSRHSWYHELTLQAELLVAKLPPTSSFNFWFSSEELKTYYGCEDAKVVMAYSNDTAIIPYSMIYDQLEKSGQTRFELPEFKRQLFQHPDSSMNSLTLYHVFGICHKGKDSAPIKVTFPGYKEKIILNN